MKMSEKMKRAKFQRINNMMVLVHDLSSVTLEEAVPVVAYCSSMIETMPDGSVFALTVMDDKTSELLTDDLLEEIGNVFQKNRAKVRKSAFVCPDGSLKSFFSKAATDARRSNVNFFSDKEEAIGWLTSRGKLAEEL